MRALLAALALCAAAGAAGAMCRRDGVEFFTPNGIVPIRVETAATEQDRARGLMSRRHLAEDAGMLFVYPEPTRAQFWMHDTLIPLDMIFADATGRVTRVHARARPMDDTVIDGGDGVRFVVEINAGLAARLSIAPGALMRSPAVDQAAAAWPCDAP